jgi:hypothetical protein
MYCSNRHNINFFESCLGKLVERIRRKVDLKESHLRSKSWDYDYKGDKFALTT